MRLALALLAAAVPLAAAEPQRVSVEVAPREVQIGDHVTVHAEISTEPGQQIAGVTLGELGENLVFAGDPQLSPVQPGGGDARVQTWDATLAVFATGEIELPPLSVLWSAAGQASSEVEAELGSITVNSVIPPGTQPVGPKDLRGPFELPVRRARWPMYVVGAALLLAAAAAWLWSRRQPRVAKPAKPARPPFEQALADLDALARSGLVEEQRHRQFFYALTDIVRVYLEAECKIHAPEMTTGELIAALREGAFPEELCGQVQRWTAACDLVKYASQRPRAEHCETAITLARAIVTSAHHHHLAAEAAAAAPAQRAA